MRLPLRRKIASCACARAPHHLPCSRECALLIDSVVWASMFRSPLGCFVGCSSRLQLH